MQALLAVVAVLLFAVAVFAFQNPDAVTVRFLHWELSASVAVVTIAVGGHRGARRGPDQPGRALREVEPSADQARGADRPPGRPASELPSPIRP